MEVENPIEESRNNITSSANFKLLFLAVVISVVNKHLSTVLNCLFIVKSQFIKSQYMDELKTHLTELQQECSQINMTDEFAKYARLQRKIIKVQDELKKEAQAQQQANMKHKFALQIFLGVVYVVLMYCYNSEPVVRFPSEWLYPVTTLVSWPGLEPGAVSFLVWCAICNSVSRSLFTRLTLT